MDGNRRFAKSLGHNTVWGHAEGFKTFKNFLVWATESEVEHVIAYCFSIENWKRSETEVKALMTLFKKALRDAKEQLKTLGPVSVIGDPSRFPKSLQNLIKEVTDATRERKGTHVHLALSYGGRNEIVRATNKIIQAKKELGKTVLVAEADFENMLDTKNIPDPDLIIRTGGEMRLSNFLPWQATYSELFFSGTLWPEFTEREFKGILLEYGKRKRNFGV